MQNVQNCGVTLTAYGVRGMELGTGDRRMEEGLWRVLIKERGTRTGVPVHG